MMTCECRRLGWIPSGPLSASDPMKAGIQIHPNPASLTPQYRHSSADIVSLKLYSPVGEDTELPEIVAAISSARR